MNILYFDDIQLVLLQQLPLYFLGDGVSYKIEDFRFFIGDVDSFRIDLRFLYGDIDKSIDLCVGELESGYKIDLRCLYGDID